MGETTLTTEQLASHIHEVGMYAHGPAGGGNTYITGYPGWTTNTETSEVGGSQAHTHDLSNASSSQSSNLPMYYALSYIMRVS